MSLVSIIIPVYNGEKYIESALNSCISQTYLNIEVLVINDGSTDNTEQIVRSYQKKHNNIILINQQNRGVSAARNKGLEIASGEWITFLDADDEIFPVAIERLLEIAEKNSADIVVGKHISISERNKLYPMEGTGEVTIWEEQKGLEMHMKDAPELYSVFGRLYNSKFFSDIRFCAGRNTHEDSFFNFLCCLKNPKIAIINTVFYKYFVSENSLSHSFFSKRKHEDIIYFTEEKGRIIRERYPEYLNTFYNVIIKSRMVFLWNTATRFDTEAQNIQREAKQTIKKYKKYFIATTKRDKKMFWLVKYNLYGLYKVFRMLKNKNSL